MVKRSTRKNPASARPGKPQIKDAKHLLSVVEAYLPEGSRQRAVVKIAAAAGGALIAAAVLGVGPAALAGAAGYLVYRKSHR
jgi:hypothetical protein